MLDGEVQREESTDLDEEVPVVDKLSPTPKAEIRLAMDCSELPVLSLWSVTSCNELESTMPLDNVYGAETFWAWT